MGYASTIVIAVHKSVVAHDLVNPLFPKCLREAGYSDEDDDARYWRFSYWKWYSSHSEIQEIEAMFKLLDGFPQISIPSKDGSIIQWSAYGAIRIGEEYGDTQSWGDPRNFRIYINHSLEYPGAN